MELNDDRLAVSLAAFSEPFTHCCRQAPRINMLARFERAFASRQRVVEFGRAGETPHAETVEPIEWHGSPLLVDNNLCA